jgi:hypothetical protein
MPRSRGDSVLPLANRIARIGGVTAGLVGVTLGAIVQQAVTPGPARPRDRHGAARDPSAAPSRSTSRPVARAARSARLTPLEIRVRTVVMRQRAALVREAFGGRRPPRPEVWVSKTDRAAGWAFGWSVIPAPPGATALPVISVFLARRKTAPSGWQVALAGTTGFVRALRAAPASVVSGGERPLLRRYGQAADLKGATGLALPWGVGQSWMSRPLAEGAGLWFGGGDGRVLAAGPGRLYRLCASAPGRGLLVLVHPNGLASVYYQLTGIVDVRDGMAVRQGAYLGRIGTDRPFGGRRPAGPAMLGFALLSADRVVPLDGTRIGGWTLHAAAGDAWAVRAGLRVEAGNPLLNFGSDIAGHAAGAATAPTDVLPSVLATVPGRTP